MLGQSVSNRGFFAYPPSCGICKKIPCTIAAPIVAAHDVFYFHWEKEAGQMLNVIVDTSHRLEFESCPERDLIQDGRAS